MTLTTKLQYKNFEPGEFIEIKKRTAGETIDLIEHFPWEEQREDIRMSLTNLSVTIEGNNGSFLKLALYYNRKFVLHYFANGQLYTRSFIRYRDTYPYITSFFEAPVFDLSGFKKENTWMQWNRIHFVTRDFHYFLTSRKIWYLLYTSGINLAAPVFIIIMMIVLPNQIPISGLIVITLFCFVACGFNLILFFNYLRFARNKILIMSKGNDLFCFGDKNNPDQYNKKDIDQVFIYRSRGYRNPINAFAVVEILFKNGMQIDIPNILVDESALKDKLFEYPQTEMNSTIPTIKSISI